jgi:hypothetical protein
LRVISVFCTLPFCHFHAFDFLPSSTGLTTR